MTNLLVYPIVIPLVTAALAIVTQNKGRAQRIIGLIGVTVQLVVAAILFWQITRNGFLVLNMGGWEAPFGIVLVADYLSAIMIMISALLGFIVALYSMADIDEQRNKFGFYPFLHLLLMGVNGTFLTGDIFNLYVWFEVMLVSSFVLLALGNEKAQLEGAVKYMVINIVSSAFLLIGITLIYGMTGTLNMADLAVRIPELESSGMATTVSMLFLVAFSIKAALFPLFFWLPSSYHTPPVAVSAIFIGLLTKVGVYVLLRFFTLIFLEDLPYTTHLLLWGSGLTMLTGVMGAIVQTDLRRAFSFLHISQIGYMVMGLAIYTPLAIMGSIFYIMHHIAVKTNLFLLSGIMHRLTGSFDIRKMGGLYRRTPWLAVLFIIPAFSLAGFPPLSGFWAKLHLVYAGLDSHSYMIVAVALIVSLLTLYCIGKIWASAFWSPAADKENQPTDEPVYPISPREWIFLATPVVILATLTLTIGLYPEPFYQLSLAAANQLLDPSQYIHAVLGP